MGLLATTKTLRERNAVALRARSSLQKGNCASVLHPGVTWPPWIALKPAEFCRKAFYLLLQINWHASKLLFWCESSGSGSFIHRFPYKCWFCSYQDHAFCERWRTSGVSEVCQSFSSFTSVILPPQSLTLKLSLLPSPSLPMSSSCEAILACFRYRKTIWPYFSKYPVFLQLRSNHRMNTPRQTPEFTVLLSNSPHLFSATSVHR